MTCMKAQSLITAFINDELDIDELEMFIDHIQSCEECREELEVYYALLTAMKQLDEDKNLSDDFNHELKEKIERSQERIIHLRYNYYRKKGILIFVMIFLTVFFSIQHYFMPREKENTVTESRFKMKMSFGEDRFSEITQMLDRYLEDIQEEAD